MSSIYSKLEKSIDDCINYNFGENLTVNSNPRFRRSKSRDSKLNGQSNEFLKKWSNFKELYPWLYIYNNNPNCTICERAVKDNVDMIETCWTSAESELDNIDLNLNEENILKDHSISKNHMLAYNFLMDKSLIDEKGKLEKEIKSNLEIDLNTVPDFMSNSEWTELILTFSWLYFKENSFRCRFCEESFDKRPKSMFPTQWTCPDRIKPVGNPSQKSNRSASRFEKHQLSINHIKAIEIIKENTNEDQIEEKPLIINSVKSKIEVKLSATPRRTVNFSQPNVTTRTAIRKSLCDKNVIPNFMDEESWNACKKDYPWIYCGNNILRCSYCEDAYKINSSSFIPTIWTCPENANDQNVPSVRHMKSKFRLNRHENTKNHETAMKLLSLSKPNVATRRASVTVEKENKNDIPEPIKSAIPTDFRAPTIAKASRKSAPVKLTNLSYDDKSMSHEKSESVKNFLQTPKQFNNKTSISEVERHANKESTGAAPSFLTLTQFNNIASRYSWFYCPDEMSYGCRICLEATKINPDEVTKTGLEQYGSDPSYFILCKKLYRHSESRNHLNAWNIVNNKSNSSNEFGSPDSRYTRLKSGSRVKIDYKRMSEGFIQNQQPDFSYNQSPPAIVTKKRKEPSSAWMCPQCKSHFSNTDDLIQHISLCDYHPSDTSRVLACPCNSSTFRFNTITKLDLHAAQEHDVQSYFHCYICSDRYNRLSSLYHHMLIHHLITWDPFEAYLPVKPSEPFVCIFCSSHHYTNLLLTKHYKHSQCQNQLQAWVVLEDINKVQNATQPLIHEEVTILDVEELPEEKEVIYSLVKKSRNQHNRINRNHPLRRLGPSLKSNHSKESIKKLKEIPKKSSVKSPEELLKMCNLEVIPTGINKQSKEQKTNIVNETKTSKFPIGLETKNVDKDLQEPKINFGSEDHDDASQKIDEQNSTGPIVQLNNIVSNSEIKDSITNLRSCEIETSKDQEHQSNSAISTGEINIDEIKNKSLTECSKEIQSKSDKASDDNINKPTIINENSNVELKIVEPDFGKNIDLKPIEKANDIDSNEALIITNDKKQTSISKIIDIVVDAKINESKSHSETKDTKMETKVSTPKSDKKSNEPKYDAKSNESGIELQILQPVQKVRKKRMSKKMKLEQFMMESNIDNSISKVTSRKYVRKYENSVNKLTNKKKTPIIELSQVVDLNEIIKETELKKLVTSPEPKIINPSNSVTVPQSAPEGLKPKKIPIKIQSQLSPCKKLKTLDRSVEEDIPTGLSFMDRMKKIRQLKKIRTEQQREQMMAVDRKIAEINEKSHGASLVDKSDRIRKLLNSEQYSMEDLKTIIQLESKHKAAEKRKLSNSDNNTDNPKQMKLPEIQTSPILATKSTNSPTKSEIFSCDVCQLKFKSLRARDNHATVYHKGLKLFCCKSCDLSFTTHILLRKHAQKYHIDNVSYAVFGKDINFSFQCSFCPLQFTSRSGLNHHITSGHKVEPDNEPMFDDFLIKLIDTDPTYSPQSCLICQEIMNNEFELHIHTIEHQKECQITETEPTQFACPKCCRLFFGRDGKSYLKDHYNIIHLEKQPPVCEDCETKFSSTVCYSLHRKTVKNCSKKTADQLKIEDPYEKLNNPSKLAFVCSLCQALVAGESAEARFEQHQTDCNAAAASSLNDDLLVIPNSQTECVDSQLLQ